jgi:hypothetical protein
MMSPWTAGGRPRSASFPRGGRRRRSPWVAPAPLWMRRCCCCGSSAGAPPAAQPSPATAANDESSWQRATPQAGAARHGGLLMRRARCLPATAPQLGPNKVPWWAHLPRRHGGGGANARCRRGVGCVGTEASLRSTIPGGAAGRLLLLLLLLHRGGVCPLLKLHLPTMAGGGLLLALRPQWQQAYGCG